MTESFKKKIPDNMHPWECEVNGVKYVYPAGTEQNVPEEVAVIIDTYWASRETEFPNTAISFNELRDRPFGEDTAVLFDQRVEFEGGDWMQSELLPISAGDAVSVTFDGEQYECVAGDMSEMIPGAVALGNLRDFSGEDTGEPFFIVIALGMGTSIVLPYFDGDGTTTSSADIRISKPVVHKLDPKFLPGGGGGGVVMVTINMDSDGNYTPVTTFQEAMDAIVNGSVIQVVVINPERPNNWDFYEINGVQVGDYIYLNDSWNNRYIWSSNDRFYFDGGSE